jgi:hypothetical protein
MSVTLMSLRSAGTCIVMEVGGVVVVVIAVSIDENIPAPRLSTFATRCKLSTYHEQTNNHPAEYTRYWLGFSGYGTE